MILLEFKKKFLCHTGSKLIGYKLFDLSINCKQTAGFDKEILFFVSMILKKSFVLMISYPNYFES